MYTKEYLLQKIKEIKPTYENEGLILLGLFGSYAKGTATQTSDIDILYELDAQKFYNTNDGFKSFTRLNQIRDELKETFHTEIDLCAKSGLSRTGEKYILADTIYF